MPQLDLNVWQAAPRSPRGPGPLNHVHVGHSSLGLEYNSVNEFTFFACHVLVRNTHRDNLCAEYFQICIILDSYRKVSISFCFVLFCFLLEENTRFQSVVTHLNCETWLCFPGAVTGILHNPTKLPLTSSGESGCLCWLAGPSRLIDLANSGTGRQPEKALVSPTYLPCRLHG